MVTKSRIAQHPNYVVILQTYNEMLQRDGRVNNLKFFRENVLPGMPEVRYDNWYAFIKKFKNAAGLLAPQHTDVTLPTAPRDAEEGVVRAMLTNDEATKRGIGLMLNIGNATLEEIAKNPELLAKMPLKERVALLTQAMKAQDSRIHAVGKIREDNRDQARFDHAFGDSAMGD